MRKVTGDLGGDGFLESQRRIPDALEHDAGRAHARRGVAMEGFWGRQSTNTRDRATAMMPRMLYDRLDELGIDFGIVYPTAGLGIPRIADDATRRAVIRGFNVVTHDYFKDLSDRLTPAAVIPVHTPEEAIEELEFVTKQLGSKVCMFGSGVRRPIPHAKGVDRRPRALRPGLRPARHRQRLRLRPGLAEMPRAWRRADLPHRRPRLRRAQQPVELHLQPYRPFRRGRA